MEISYILINFSVFEQFTVFPVWVSTPCLSPTFLLALLQLLLLLSLFLSPASQSPFVRV